MKSTLLMAALGAALLASPALAQDAKAPKSTMKLGSADVKAKEKIPEAQVFAGFGCAGGNKSPALAWSGAPAGTKSFALTMYDPDAPTGSGWWHWVAFNIPANAAKLATGASDAAGGMPAGTVQSMTDFGKPGYGGPCPPQGAKPHRYIFTVYALSLDKIPLDDKASGALAGFYIKANALDKASFTAMYGR